MKKSFITILIIIIIICSLIIIIACSKNDKEQAGYTEKPEQVEYNENPDLSSKVVGSALTSPSAVRELLTTVDDLIKNADLIIIGKVLDNGVPGEYNTFGSLDKDTEDLFKERGVSTKSSCTYTQIKVMEVIGGRKPETDEIVLFQLGKPGVDDIQAKVKKDEVLLMILRESTETKNLYYAHNLEDSLFYIDDNDKVLSMSHTLICARYDGLAKDILIRDLKQSSEFKKIIEKSK